MIVDPPYEVTSLKWDKLVQGWEAVAHASLLDTGSLWLFGSMRSIVTMVPELERAGFRYAQEVVWQKQNGSGFHKDRFRRVHEFVVQFYKSGIKWRDVYNDVQYTNDATRRTVRRKTRPPHMGHIEKSAYRSEDGGPRMMTSILPVRNCHGRAIHPTEKPVELLEILIRTSCPEGGVVGDMFAGSAAVGEACLNLNRRYVGYELDAEMHMKAQERLAKCSQSIALRNTPST